MGRACTIYKPLLLSNPRFISIGDGCFIRQGARIEALVVDDRRPPSLVIGNNVNIEQNAHLICSSSLRIGDNVSIAPNCAILDTTHPFFDVTSPIKVGNQINTMPSPVQIGDNTLVGMGAVILHGVTIGRNCVIGANCTVSRDVPDFCVVAGNPAMIIMRYDWNTNSWTR